MTNTLPYKRPHLQLDREHDAPKAPRVFPGLIFHYNGRKYEVEQLIPGNRAICHSFYGSGPSTILSFAAITGISK